MDDAALARLFYLDLSELLLPLDDDLPDDDSEDEDDDGSLIDDDDDEPLEPDGLLLLRLVRHCENSSENFL